VCDNCGEHVTGRTGSTRDGARIIVVGHAGVGRTTVSALVARILARSGGRVVVVDGSDDSRLGALLGTTDTDTVTGGDGVRLVHVGPDRPWADVPALGPGEVLVADGPAGQGTCGRSLVRGFDVVLVVVDPRPVTVSSGLELALLAAGEGIGTVHLVVNRTATDTDVLEVLVRLDDLGGFGFDSVTSLPDDRAVDGVTPVDGLLAGSALGDAAIGLVAGALSPGVLTAVRAPVGAPA